MRFNGSVILKENTFTSNLAYFDGCLMNTFPYNLTVPYLGNNSVIQQVSLISI